MQNIPSITKDLNKQKNIITLNHEDTVFLNRLLTDFKLDDYYKI